MECLEILRDHYYFGGGAESCSVAAVDAPPAAALAKCSGYFTSWGRVRCVREVQGLPHSIFQEERLEFWTSL